MVTEALKWSFRQESFQQEAPIEVLGRHGRSFHFAGQFLGRHDLAGAARLYAFCRYVDDLADRCDNAKDASHQLDQLDSALMTGLSNDGRIADFLALANEQSIDLAVAHQFIQGVRSDLGVVAFADPQQLVRYCYRVAGTVGLMMCSVLGVVDKRALRHAIDLGIAMQLTNIARDVIEDARLGRCYLPKSVLGQIDVQTIASEPATIDHSLREAVRWSLNLAESYYRSGEAGLKYLPARPRFAILVAARVYRAIGHELAARNYTPWIGRAVVPLHRKIWQASLAAADTLRRKGKWRHQLIHQSALHEPITGLPGANLPDPVKPCFHLDKSHG